MGVGILQAVKQDSYLDSALSGITLFFYSMPSFWLAIRLYPPARLRAVIMSSLPFAGSPIFPGLFTSPDIVEQVCKAIISEFDSLIPDYYHADDLEKGFVEGTDRYGVKRRFSIMSISIAVVSDVQRSFTSPIEIAKVATEIKDYVKSLPGSNYLIDRRVTTRCDS